MEIHHSINRSGFPLQIGLAHAIDSSNNDHGWRVLHQEHGWSNPQSETSGFIDLVVENYYRTVVLNIECKRPQEATWQFLLPKPNNKPRLHCKFWATHGNYNGLTYCDWVDLTIEPSSFESKFCVVSGQDAKSRPMLERIASTVVESTEALAREEADLIAKQNTQHLRTYINVIATTAKLEVCQFDPTTIDLNTGKITEASSKEVPYVRFRKQLSVASSPLASTDWDSGLQAITNHREHTVLIVQANHLLKLLPEIAISDNIAHAVHMTN